jgi:type I restriction enzyme S subunit
MSVDAKEPREALFHFDISFARRSQTAATKHLNLQNQELTTLRDWLLPMLMNGQVRVTE